MDSSNFSVAKIDVNGVVTWLKSGTVVITAILGVSSATRTVRVSQL